MAFYPSFNLIESIVDEVALEGLDGITLQGNIIISIHFDFCVTKVNHLKMISILDNRAFYTKLFLYKKK